MGGWQELLLQSSDIIVYSIISHYKPLIEAVAAPAGLHHQWVGDRSDVDGMVVTGYGTIARAQWHRDWHDGSVERWHGHNGAGTMAQARWPWPRQIGTGTAFVDSWSLGRCYDDSCVLEGLIERQ